MDLKLMFNNIHVIKLNANTSHACSARLLSHLMPTLTAYIYHSIPNVVFKLSIYSSFPK